MSAWMIAFVGLQYAVIAGLELKNGNVWMSMVFVGYAFSNVALYKLALITGSVA
jgi:hypothetical protein